MTCECGWKAKRGQKGITECPDCGSELDMGEFILGKGDILLCDEKGKEVAIGVEIHGGYRLRMRGRPTMYVSNIVNLLRCMREGSVKLDAKNQQSMEQLVQLHKDADEFMHEMGGKIEKKIKELSEQVVERRQTRSGM